MASITRFVDCQLNPVDENNKNDDGIVDALETPAKKKLKMNENDSCCNQEMVSVCGGESSNFARIGSLMKTTKNTIDVPTMNINSGELDKLLLSANIKNNNNLNNQRLDQKNDFSFQNDTKDKSFCNNERFVGNGTTTAASVTTTPTVNCLARSRPSKQAALCSSSSSRFVYPTTSRAVDSNSDLLNRHSSTIQRRLEPFGDNELTHCSTTKPMKKDLKRNSNIPILTGDTHCKTTSNSVNGKSLKNDDLSNNRLSNNTERLHCSITISKNSIQSSDHNRSHTNKIDRSFDQENLLDLPSRDQKKQHDELVHNIPISPGSRKNCAPQNGSKKQHVVAMVAEKDEFDVSDDLDFSAINSQLLKRNENSAESDKPTSNLNPNSKSSRLIRDISSNFGIALKRKSNEFSGVNQSNVSISALHQSEQDVTRNSDQLNTSTTINVSTTKQSNLSVSAFHQSDQSVSTAFDQSSVHGIDVTFKGSCIDSPTVDLFGDSNLDNDISGEDLQLSPCLANQRNSIDEIENRELSTTNRIANKKLFGENQNLMDDKKKLILPKKKKGKFTNIQSEAFDRNLIQSESTKDTTNNEADQLEPNKDVVRRRKKGKRITRNLRRSARKGSFSATEQDENKMKDEDDILSKVRCFIFFRRLVGI